MSSSCTEERLGTAADSQQEVEVRTVVMIVRGCNAKYFISIRASMPTTGHMSPVAVHLVSQSDSSPRMTLQRTPRRLR